MEDRLNGALRHHDEMIDLTSISAGGNGRLVVSASITTPCALPHAIGVVPANAVGIELALDAAGRLTSTLREPVPYRTARRGAEPARVDSGTGHR